MCALQYQPDFAAALESVGTSSWAPPALGGKPSPLGEAGAGHSLATLRHLYGGLGTRIPEYLWSVLKSKFNCNSGIYFLTLTTALCFPACCLTRASFVLVVTPSVLVERLWYKHKPHKAFRK